MSDEAADDTAAIVPTPQAVALARPIRWRGMLDARQVTVRDPVTKSVVVHTVPDECAANVSTILTCHPDWQCVGFDEFQNEIIIGKEPPTRPQDKVEDLEYPRYWGDDDTTRLQNWIKSEVGFEPHREWVQHAVYAAAKRNAFHAVRAWLKDLPAWDGVCRLSRFFPDYFGAADDTYNQRVGACFLISLVARVLDPGCKADTMPIIEGMQGRFKSRAVAALVGKAWFSCTPPEWGHKDAYQNLKGVWLLEVPELDGMARADIRRIKSYLSTPIDTYRPSFGRYSIKVPRQSILIGTTNENEYFTDQTGGRRFWPVRGSGFADVDAITRDREQLFAEAVARFNAGEQHWLTSDEEKLAQSQQAKRLVEDPWLGPIAGWLMTVAAKREYVTASEVLEYCVQVPLERHSAVFMSRVAGCLKELGWEPSGDFRPRRYYNGAK